jgi:hypothetical protein
VEQISLPYRIALVALLVVGAVWFAVLRPKSGGEAEPASTPAPGVTGLANDVTKAKDAVDTANAASGAAATTSPAKAAKATKPAAAAATKPAPKPVKPAKPGLADDAAPGDPSRPLLADVDSGKVAVVLFWSSKGSDDRATRRALRAVDRHHGNVVATAIPVSDVGKYEAITRGAQILESPTVLVIGAGGKARSITGYTQAKEIDQAVSDIGGTGFEAKKAFALKGFASVADDACKDFSYALDQKADPPTTVHGLTKVLGIGEREEKHARARMAKAKASGAAERDLKAALVAYLDKDTAWIADARRKLKAGVEPGNVFLALVQLEETGNAGFNAAAKKARVRGCYADS